MNYTGLYSSFYSWYTDNLLETWYYLWKIVDWIQPTINFMYDNFLSNPYIIVLILVLLVLSLFTFWE